MLTGGILTIFRHWRWQRANTPAVQMMAAGQLAEAEPQLLAQIETAEKWFGPESSRVANALHNLAELRRMQGRQTEVESVLRSALAILEKAEPESLYTALVWQALAEAYEAQERLDDALVTYRRSFEILERATGQGAVVLSADARSSWDQQDEFLATSLEKLGMLCATMGRYKDAIPLLKRSLAMREAVNDPLGRTGPGQPGERTSGWTRARGV